MKKKEKIKEVVQDVRELWYAPTKETFKVVLEKFFTKWDVELGAYAEYFRRTWIERFPPLHSVVSKVPSQIR